MGVKEKYCLLHGNENHVTKECIKLTEIVRIERRGKGKSDRAVSQNSGEMSDKFDLTNKKDFIYSSFLSKGNNPFFIKGMIYGAFYR
jgi:hypothetical protein